MTGIVLDGVLMLLLVTALGYGVRLEKKLTALRAGQLAFADAVTELNTAAARAESALGSLRVAGEEADMLHDRILKARAVKQELEVLIARAPSRAIVTSPSPEVGRDVEPQARPGGEVSTSRAVLDSPTRTAPPSSLLTRGRENAAADLDDDRALRMAALAERIQGMAAPRIQAPGRDNVSAILGALAAAGGASARANQTPQHSPNRPARSLDDDLFAA